MKGYKRIGAVQKACEILTFLSEHRASTSIGDLSMALDMPKPTLLCYLSTLEDSGLVSRTGEKYELGFKMAMFWASYRTTQKEKIEDIQGLLKQLEIDDEQ